MFDDPVVVTKTPFWVLPLISDPPLTARFVVPAFWTVPTKPLAKLLLNVDVVALKVSVALSARKATPF